MRPEEWRERYRGLGFATIPVVPRGKRPLRKGWLDAGVSQWDGAPAHANLGILTGSRSGGLVVLDFDTSEGPEEILGMTPKQLAVLTIVVETKRGWHVYTRADNVGSTTARAGLDVRGENSMVLAPPSVHPSGKPYAFVGSPLGVVRLDAIAPELLKPVSSPVAVELETAEAWIVLQAPRLQDAWRRLREPPSFSWDASRADFAVARCLWEAGWAPEEVAALLVQLPGSRARERGQAYALQTARRAAAVPRRAR